MARFVDRIEKRTMVKPEPEKMDVDQMAEIRAQIPADAFETNILDSGLPEHIAYILQEAGYSTTAELAIQMKLQPDDILRLNGIGPRAMQEITNLMSALDERAAAEREALLAEQAEQIEEVGEAEPQEVTA